MADSPLVSVVVPVLNRPDKLRRALSSVAAQTLTDFECIVIDDESTVDLRPIVAEFDERFVYVRRERNGGCSSARLDGFSRVRGTYVTTLDSDNTMYPWALARAAALLDEHPEADCVTGLYVFPDGLRVRIDGGQLLVTPEDFADSIEGGSDCMALVRRPVVDLWMTRRTDYYNLDQQLWFAMSLTFSQLYVDEPWAAYHYDGGGRISVSKDPRQYEDLVKFVEQFEDELGTLPSRPLDRILRDSWFTLWRAGRKDDAAVVTRWMHARGLRRRHALVFGLRRALRRRIGRGAGDAFVFKHR